MEKLHVPAALVHRFAQIVQQWCHAQPAAIPRASTLAISHLLIPHLSPAHISSSSSPQVWSPPLETASSPSPSPQPGAQQHSCPKHDAYSSVLTPDLIIDSKEKGFLHFVSCCWTETTSPDFCPLISMNNGKLHIGWSSRLSPKARPKSKPNSPEHFWRLYSDPGGMISHPP